MGGILRDIIKKTAFKSIFAEPVLGYMRRTRLHDKIVIVMYHEIAEDHDDIESWTVVRKSDFISQMEYLSRHFTILSLAEALDILKNPLHKPGKKPAAVVTFDDGYAGNFKVMLPVVKKMGIPVTVFVATRAVKERIVHWYDSVIMAFQGGRAVDISLDDFSLGRYALNRVRGAENWKEIERLLIGLKSLSPSAREEAVRRVIRCAGPFDGKSRYRMESMTIDELKLLAECPDVTIGAHSHCHSLLPQLEDKEIEKTVRASKDLLEDWLKRPIRYFAYPNGLYNSRVIEAVKKAGFECALTTEQSICRYGESPYKMPRLGFGRYDTLDLFKIRTSGGLIPNKTARPGEVA